MFNNVFNKKDPVADMIAQIAEADYKAKMEELKGQQHKIDKNKNNKIDADDFKILRGEKKGMKKEEANSVEETNNPFDWRNTKSRLPTKPGDKAGFDSKKISTGTVYTRRPVKDEPVKKEEIDPNDTTTDTLKGREKTSDNKFLSKKVMMDVPDNVKEEVDQIDELSPGLLDRASKKAEANAKFARAKGHVEAGDEHMGQAVRLRSGYHDAVERDRKKASMSSMSPAKQRKYAISQKRAMGEEYAYEENEQIDELDEAMRSGFDYERADRAREQMKAKGFEPGSRPYTWRRIATKPQEPQEAPEKKNKGVNESEQIDERQMTEPEMKKREKIVKSMKKGMQGFKDRYGERAKNVMYATATKQAMKD